MAPATDSVQHTPENSASALLGSHQAISDAVLHAIVVSRGVPGRAREILEREHGLNLSTADLYKYLEGRLPELKEQMELVACLELFGLMPQLHKTLTENLSSLDPASSVRAYMDLMKLIQGSTSKNELNVNIHEEIWHRAPRDVQQLFAQLEAAGKLGELDSVIEHMPDEERVA